MQPYSVGFLLLLSVSVAASRMDAASTQRAEMNYLLNCASCHQVSGKGSPGSVPDLGEYLGQFAQHPDSRSFLAQVPGSSSARISPQELADVLNWILYTMNAEQLKADFVPYTANEVEEYRNKPVVEVHKVRLELIEKVINDYSQ